MAFIGIIGGMVVEGGHPQALLSQPSFMIVMVGSSSTFTDTVRVRIDSPNVVIGRDPRTNTYIRCGRLCLDRLYFLHQFMSNVRNVDPSQILTEFRYSPGPTYPLHSPATAGWDDRAVLTLAFTNSAK